MIMRALLAVLERSPLIYEGFRAAFRAHEMRRLPSETPFGFRLIGTPEMEKGQFEPKETQQITAQLNSCDVFINVGANVGYYCLHARKSGKQVIAIEPLWRNVALLQKNLEANDWMDVEVLPVALSDRVGLAKIFGGGTAASLLPGWAGSDKSRYSIVPTSTLDNVVGGRFEKRRLLILIDVEGLELSVLRGACKTLLRTPSPIWFVEICIDEHQPNGRAINPKLRETFKCFLDAGYTAEKAGCEIGPVTPADVELWQSGLNLPKTHNFIFRKITADIQ